MTQPLTLPEAAAALRCSERTVRRAIKRGEIRATLFGGRYLIAPENLPTALTPPPPPPPRRPGKAGPLTQLARSITPTEHA